MTVIVCTLYGTVCLVLLRITHNCMQHNDERAYVGKTLNSQITPPPLIFRPQGRDLGRLMQELWRKMITHNIVSAHKLLNCYGAGKLIITPPNSQNSQNGTKCNTIRKSPSGSTIIGSMPLLATDVKQMPIRTIIKSKHRCSLLIYVYILFFFFWCVCCVCVCVWGGVGGWGGGWGGGVGGWGGGLEGGGEGGGWGGGGGGGGWGGALNVNHA